MTIVSSRPLATITKDGVITRVEGTLEECRRLFSLGFAPGRRVKVHVYSGILVVEVDNSIIVLDRELASKILVDDCDEG